MLIRCAFGATSILADGSGQYVYVSACELLGSRTLTRRIYRVHRFQYEQDAINRLTRDNLLGCGPVCYGPQEHFAGVTSAK